MSSTATFHPPIILQTDARKSIGEWPPLLTYFCLYTYHVIYIFFFASFKKKKRFKQWNRRRNTLCLTTKTFGQDFSSRSAPYLISTFCLFLSSACLSLSHPHLLSPLSHILFSFIHSTSSSSQRGLSPGGVAQGHVSAPWGAVSSSPLLSFTSISISISPWLLEQLTSIFLSCLAQRSIARVMDWKL